MNRNQHRLIENAAESLGFALEGRPGEAAARTWLAGFWAMNVEIHGHAGEFEGLEDFTAAVLAAQR